MKNSLLLLLIFLLGVLVGRMALLPTEQIKIDLASLVLLFLLFLVGMAVGSNDDTWRIIRQRQARILMVPLVIILGTLLGAALASYFLPAISLREGLAVGAGFGYYSLSSVVITELSGERLGVIALLANVLRELFTLLFAPLLVRLAGRLAPIASGGATAMDTTLPIISRVAGERYALIAVFSGAVLTILVPFLVTALLSW